VNRWVALLLAVIGGAAVALALLMFGTAALAGLLWIFVFGDDPWPGWVGPALDIAIPIVGLGLWALFSWAIWNRLKSPHRAG
jgi:hypothetical protein